MFFGLFKKRDQIKKASSKRLTVKRSTTAQRAKTRRPPLRPKTLTKRTQRSTTPLPSKRPPAKEKRRGTITHYFGNIGVGVVKITDGTIRLGDTLHIIGHTTNFTQKVTSLQINHVPIRQAKKGDEIGLKVRSRVRTGDRVYQAS